MSKFPRWFLLVAAIAVFFSACRRDKDRIPPSVVITQPGGTLPAYNYDEAIGITFTATDEGGISRWAIRLTDEQGLRRFSTDYFGVAGAPANMQRQFTITLDDIHWPSGDYTLGVFVVDEAGNEGAAFRKVRYNEAPLKRERVYVIRDTGGGTAVDSLTSSGDLVQATIFGSDFSTSFAGSFHGELLIGGATSGTLRFLERTSLIETGLHSQPNPLGGNFFRAIAYAPSTHTYYASCFDGLIREFGRNGLLKSSFEVPANFRPEHIAVVGNKVVCTLRSIGGNNYLLASFFRNSGALAASQAITHEVASLLPFEDNLLMISNTSDATSKLFLVNQSNFAINEIQWLISSTPVRTAIALDNGYYAVAHTNGVWGYRFGTGQFFSGDNNGVDVTSLSYDRVNNQIFATGSGLLHRIAASNGNLIDSRPAPNVRAVEVMFNK